MIAPNILIEPKELACFMAKDNIAIVDTRSKEAFEAAHIKGAVNIPDIFTYLASSDKTGISAMRKFLAKKFGDAGINNKKTVVFYEQDMRSGFGQSCRGHFILSYLGNDNSHVLHGGLDAWVSNGYSVTEFITKITPANFELSEAGKSLIVDKYDVLSSLNQNMVTLLDVRDVDEWIGESSSPYGKDFSPRKGRIPGAKWLEWYRMMKPDGSIKSPNEVRAECLNAGIDFSKPIWLYCFKGSRTSNTYVALKQAGFKNIATYFGSWNEWSQDQRLPIETGMPER
ncbi:sulfurtransferase [Kordiimonas laminariae]|uniref:sulfurtransferase n=1 Tax=Kordiimonas laminariae TaxID=2917717 RepID=UPI00248AA70B|nr:sulfurtransferase [Kordiimonas laminariae]